MPAVARNKGELTKSRSLQMERASTSLDFLDYLGAERGIQRGAASALLGEWLLAEHQARGLGVKDCASRVRIGSEPAEERQLVSCEANALAILGN